MKCFLILAVLFSMNAWGVSTLRCQYNNELNDLEFSLHGFEKKTFNKKFQIKDKHYSVKIEDIYQPSEVDDYIVIEKGTHKITYSLKCQYHSNEVAKAYSPSKVFP